MFSLEADSIPFDNTELSFTTIQYFGKSRGATVRRSDPKYMSATFWLCDLWRLKLSEP